MKKVKGFLKKGLTFFKRDGAKFIQSLSFFNTKKREITMKSLGFLPQKVEKVRFCRYFPQNYRSSDAFSLRYTRRGFRLIDFARFSSVKVCIKAPLAYCTPLPSLCCSSPLGASTLSVFWIVRAAFFTLAFSLPRLYFTPML